MVSDLIQTSFDYSLVSEEQANQLQVIYNRVLVRHMSTAYEDGKDMLEAKSIKGLSYKDFIAWAQSCYGWSENIINAKINVALNWGITPPGGVIDDHAIYLLSTKRVPESARQEAKALLIAGKDIDEESAKKIRDAHKAREQAEEAQRKAEQKVQLAQQLLFNEKMQSQETIKKLNQQIAILQKEKEDLSKPDEVIKEVDRPETIARLEQLEADIKKAIMQRDNLSKMVDEFSATLDAKEEEKEREARELRVRMEWQRAADTMYKNTIKFLGQLPTPLDTQLFESDEWAVLDQLVDVFQRAANECKQLHRKPALMIVEAE